MFEETTLVNGSAQRIVLRHSSKATSCLVTYITPLHFTTTVVQLYNDRSLATLRSDLTRSKAAIGTPSYKLTEPPLYYIKKTIGTHNMPSACGIIFDRQEVITATTFARFDSRKVNDLVDITFTLHTQAIPSNILLSKIQCKCIVIEHPRIASDYIVKELYYIAPKTACSAAWEDNFHAFVSFVRNTSYAIFGYCLPATLPLNDKET